MASYYVKWQEVCVSVDKGRREVHYYLKRRDGASDLAVVGKEKTLRHMSYHYAIKDLSLLSLSNSSSLLKLRSRREVIDWLNSIVPVTDSDPHKPDRPVVVYPDSNNTGDDNLGVLKNVQMGQHGKHATEFMWLGSPWTCRKKRKHYQSFNRNGVIVSVHEFVYVLAEEDKKLVAYLDDIYEDSRDNRMVVVRWFHKIDEVGIVLPHNYNDREIFFSLCLQTLSIECIDGLASVLSPQHYEKFSSEVRHTQVKPFVCRWQFDNDDLQPFDITRIKGYWDQDIIKYLSFQSPARIKPACYGLKGGGNDIDSVGSRPKKRLRLTKAGDMYKLSTQRKETVEFGLKDVNSNPKEGWFGVYLPAKDVLENSWCFTIGSQVEVLSQDSGIRGCWLRAMIVKKHKNKVKVQYQDIKDADDEAKYLEEWVFTSKLAAADAFGARISGRSILRPSPMSNTGKVSWAVNIGCIVDVWWHNGWWEGIVVEKVSEDKLHVYLLGEKREMIFGLGDLRHSQEWLGDGWRNLKESPELVSALAAFKANQVINDSCHNEQEEQTSISDCQELSSVPCKNSLDNTSNTGLVEGQENKIDEPTVVRDLSKDNLLAQLRWKSSGKRRHCRSPAHKVHYGVNTSQNGRDLVMGSSKQFFFPSVKVDHDNCKYISDSVFTSVVSPLTSLVMSSNFFPEISTLVSLIGVSEPLTHTTLFRDKMTSKRARSTVGSVVASRRSKRTRTQTETNDEPRSSSYLDVLGDQAGVIAKNKVALSQKQQDDALEAKETSQVDGDDFSQEQSESGDASKDNEDGEDDEDGEGDDNNNKDGKDDDNGDGKDENDDDDDSGDGKDENNDDEKITTTDDKTEEENDENVQSTLPRHLVMEEIQVELSLKQS